MDRWTIGALLDTTTEYLRDRGSSSPRLDAELLLAETLGMERIDLYTEYDRPLTSLELDRYRSLVRRRAKHEPVAYILGRAHFRRLCLEVSPAVLIPRPETEELVDIALELLRLRPAWEASARTTGERPRDRRCGHRIRGDRSQLGPRDGGSGCLHRCERGGPGDRRPQSSGAGAGEVGRTQTTPTS